MASPLATGGSFCITMPRIALHTLGCKLNAAETATIGRQFLARGYRLVEFGQPAEDSDPSHYLGTGNPQIELETTLSPDFSCPGTDEVAIPAGGNVLHCLALTNTGDTYVSEISVTDSLGQDVCVVPSLAPGE